MDALPEPQKYDKLYVNKTSGLFPSNSLQCKMHVFPELFTLAPFPTLLEKSVRQNVMSHLHLLSQMFSFPLWYCNPTNKSHKTKPINSLSNLIATVTASISPSYPLPFSFANASVSSCTALHFPQLCLLFCANVKTLPCNMLLQDPHFPSISNPTAI